MKTRISPPEWIRNETKTADLGDKRLDSRMGLVLNDFSKHPQASICAATGGHKEMVAAYRFLDNSHTDEKSVLAAHRDATLERMAAYQRVLVVHDTTEADFTGREPIPGAGYLEGEHSQGFYLHPLIALSEERLCLGSLWVKIWARPEYGIKETRVNRLIEEKESLRWLQGYWEACKAARQLPGTQVISITDAEGDIYEHLAARDLEELPRADYVIRACQDRRTDSFTQRLWSVALQSPILGEVEARVSKHDETPARTAQVTVQTGKVTLWPPERSPEEQQLPVTVYFVLAREPNPPQGVERIEWLLLTSLPVTDFEEALKILKYYTCRWEIEIFFRVLKTGCQIERLQLGNAERLRPAFALYMIVTWRILYLTMLGRSDPALPCDVVLEESEWKSVWVVTQKKAVPKKPPSLQLMVRLIATLGGFKGRKSDGEPGPKVMWEGLCRVYDLAWAWNTFGPDAPRSNA
jgi:Transposase Tn5 dimerisation domain/Transposase DNA-binding